MPGHLPDSIYVAYFHSCYLSGFFPVHKVLCSRASASVAYERRLVYLTFTCLNSFLSLTASSQPSFRSIALILPAYTLQTVSVSVGTLDVKQSCIARSFEKPIGPSYWTFLWSLQQLVSEHLVPLLRRRYVLSGQHRIRGFGRVQRATTAQNVCDRRKTRGTTSHGT